MRLVCLSDTHGLHEYVTVPPGDVLIHCGDSTKRGTLEELETFSKWMGGFAHQHKLLIAGNHDVCFETSRTRVQAQEIVGEAGITYLKDSFTRIQGLKFYGTPWVPKFNTWAFMLPRGGLQLEQKRHDIPIDTDVLISHGPAFNIRDEIDGQSVGCELLGNRLGELKNLKAHIFGHIHTGYGTTLGYGRWAINCAVCNEDYDPVNKPICITI